MVPTFAPALIPTQHFTKGDAIGRIDQAGSAQRITRQLSWLTMNIGEYDSKHLDPTSHVTAPLLCPSLYPFARIANVPRHCPAVFVSGAFLTQRNPIESVMHESMTRAFSPVRRADRQASAVELHPPPRTTLISPVFGPGGFLNGQFL